MTLPTVAVTAVSMVAPVLAIALPGSEESLPIPTWAYALIAFAAFLFLAFVVWSYRDVANRHSHKTRGSAGHDDGTGPAEHD